MEKPGCGEARRSCLRNLLVCFALPADVFGHALDASEGYQLSCFLGYGYCSYDPPLLAYDPNPRQVRNESLRLFLGFRVPFVPGVEGRNGDVDDG